MLVRNLLLVLFIPVLAFSQNSFKMNNQKMPSTIGTPVDINPLIKGTLLLDEAAKVPTPLVLLIPGTASTDRNGNMMMNRNDSYKQLALALQEKGIATYRYDKRSFTLVSERKPTANLSFDDFVADGKAVVAHFENDKRFSKIILAGHSQGALVAMLAMSDTVDGFISIAGAADAIDAVIVQQLAVQAPGLDKEAAQLFARMKSQDSLVTGVSSYLESIASPEIQPFMKSWMAYNPTDLIKEIKKPILIVNGTSDRQSPVDQAEKLHAANPSSQLLVIKQMNHIFKKVGDDDIEAAKSNNDPSFPLHPELVASIVSFVRQLDL